MRSVTIPTSGLYIHIHSSLCASTWHCSLCCVALFVCSTTQVTMSGTFANFVFTFNFIQTKLLPYSGFQSRRCQSDVLFSHFMLHMGLECNIGKGLIWCCSHYWQSHTNNGRMDFFFLSPQFANSTKRNTNPAKITTWKIAWDFLSTLHRQLLLLSF